MPTGRARHGTGRIYLPKKGSTVYWIQLTHNGAKHRESTGTSDKRRAINFLDRRRAEIVTGNFVVDPSKITISHLVSTYMEEIRVNRNKTVSKSEERWRLHLMPSFEKIRANKLTSDLVREYISSRQAEGASNATINRELSVLKRAYRIAIENDPPRVARLPKIPRLKEDNVRKGFLELPQYEKLLRECIGVGAWLRGILETGYIFGWRDEEVTTLRARRVDLVNRCIRLYPGETKNDDGRIAFMTTGLYEALAPLMRGKSDDDYVFTREDGSPVFDFRKTWWKVCTAARLGTMICRKCKATSDSPSCCKICHSDNIGYRGLLFHDLRRTAIRNMVRRGIPEKWAMQVTGHKTRSVFERYNIVCEGDLRETARRMEEGERRERDELARFKSGFGHTLDIPAHKKVQYDGTRERCNSLKI
jgi:integrase